jgi:predicted AAA+ superfamily ATPase
MAEVGPQNADRLWIRGGFPRSYLPRTGKESIQWREEFVQTFLERDIPQLGFSLSSVTLRRFWTMLAHYHGQTWNASEFGRSFGVSDMTVRKYLDTLTSTFVIRQLQPWRENIRKRQVASPKVYVSDSGILHALLGLPTMRDLTGHPKLGASWEGFAMDQVVTRLGARPEECYFWATHAGAELDLLVIRGRKRLGFEFKRTSSPKITSSVRSALADLGLNHLDIVYPGTETFPLGKKVRALGLTRLLNDLSPMR